jgi:hypothetical protein
MGAHGWHPIILPFGMERNQTKMEDIAFHTIEHTKKELLLAAVTVPLVSLPKRCSIVAAAARES